MNKMYAFAVGTVTRAADSDRGAVVGFLLEGHNSKQAVSLTLNMRAYSRVVACHTAPTGKWFGNIARLLIDLRVGEEVVIERKVRGGRDCFTRWCRVAEMDAPLAKSDGGVDLDVELARLYHEQPLDQSGRDGCGYKPRRRKKPRDQRMRPHHRSDFRRNDRKKLLRAA